MCLVPRVIYGLWATHLPWCSFRPSCVQPLFWPTMNKKIMYPRRPSSISTKRISFSPFVRLSLKFLATLRCSETCFAVSTSLTSPFSKHHSPHAYSNSNYCQHCSTKISSCEIVLVEMWLVQKMHLAQRTVGGKKKLAS